jgi:ATP-dependent Zn protease
MKRTRSQLESTAYHEAGHAIAEWRLLVRVPRRLTIEPDGDSLGFSEGSNPLIRVDIEWDDSPRAQRKAENLVRILLAGPAACENTIHEACEAITATATGRRRSMS